MDTKEESSMKQGSSMNGSKPQLKTGYTDKNGNVVSDTKTFHFLKKELSFFITPDLPFRLPPCEPRREGNHHEDLLSVPAGSIFDSVSFTDESGLPEERIAYAKFEPTTKDGKIGISFTNSEGEDVQKQDIHMWYTDDELQDLGQKCIKKYDAAESEDFSLHMAAVTEWVHKRRTWEWEAFCLARQHHAKIHWSNDAQYDEVMAAEKHSSLLSLVEWYGFTDK